MRTKPAFVLTSDWSDVTGVVLRAAACLAVCLLGMGTARAAGQSMVTFDAPGANIKYSSVCANAFGGFLGCGTLPLANNDRGEVVGTYTDTHLAQHGFLRTPEGSIATIDAPGAGTGKGQGTAAFAINDRGVIAGGFQDSKGVYHAFLRYVGGNFLVFDAPGAGTGPQQGTLATNVNDYGETAGTFIASSGTNHGFAGWPEYDLVPFDPADSVFTYPCEETCLNPDGTVVGFYVDGTTGTTRGFVRWAEGHIATIDAPGAATGPLGGTIAASINPAGVITGYSVDSNNVAHGFLFAPGRRIQPWDDPDASLAPGNGTAPFSINASGAITGVYWDSSGLGHGFERAPGQTPDNFVVTIKGTAQYTRPSTNNAWGQVTGWYVDSKNVNHGFIWNP